MNATEYANAERWAAEDEAQRAAELDAGITDDMRAEGWKLAGDGTVLRSCARRYCGHHVYKPATGRTPKYCSESCRQMDYRDRKATTERDRATRDAIDQVERVVALELARLIPPNSRVSTTQQSAMPAAIVRALMLTGKLRLP